MGVSSSESHDLTAFYEMLTASFGVLSQNTGFYPSLDRIIATTLRPLNLGPGGGSYNELISRLQRPNAEMQPDSECMCAHMHRVPEGDGRWWWALNGCTNQPEGWPLGPVVGQTAPGAGMAGTDRRGHNTLRFAADGGGGGAGAGKFPRGVRGGGWGLPFRAA